jgi:hypothetical protein
MIVYVVFDLTLLTCVRLQLHIRSCDVFTCFLLVYCVCSFRSLPFLPVPLGLIADVAVINPYSSIACMQGARARIVSSGLLSSLF